MAAPMQEGVQCSFALDIFQNHITCGNSVHYSATENTKTIVPLYSCDKTTQYHLQTLHCIDKSHVATLIPESLLILYRSGIFDVGSKPTLNLTICQKHRDYYGIYWKKTKETCGFPGHPPHSKAKADRGATFKDSKLFWIATRQLIPVGTGLCKTCSGKLKKDYCITNFDISQDIALCKQIKENTTIVTEHEGDQSENLHEIQDIGSQLSDLTQTTYGQSSQQSASDWEKDNESGKERFNRAMMVLGKGHFENQLDCQLSIPWKDTSRATKHRYLSAATEAINLVLAHIVPGQESTILTEILKKQSTVDECSTIEKQDILTRALVKAYQDQNNRQTQMQILSLFAHKFSKEHLMKLIPGLTVFKIDAARRHALLESPGQLICKRTITRCRLSKPKILHFLEFISSPSYHQAVGYGSKKIILSTGVEIMIPTVVRNIISARLISTYLAYCEDQNFETFTRSTLYNIINVCISSQKKNLHGLDNISAEGMKAVDILYDIVSKLQIFGLPSEKVDQLNNLIAALNQHLKFEIKGHLRLESECINHCTVYSLSDPKSNLFREKIVIMNTLQAVKNVILLKKPLKRSMNHLRIKISNLAYLQMYKKK